MLPPHGAWVIAAIVESENTLCGSTNLCLYWFPILPENPSSDGVSHAHEMPVPA